MDSNTAAPARYRIVQTIGRGGMGEVCLADDLMLHRQVALKFLSTPGDGDALELLSEARAAAALDHPFICSIYEVTTLDSRPCIAMEYVRGETFERRLRRGPLAVIEALRVAEEIAEALEAAHKRRIVHRDLKPANVMLTDNQHIKVMDFGLATRLPADDIEADAKMTIGRPGVVVRGTPAYMAPEQIRGLAADHRSDVFSFGILLYELLSGTNPFHRVGIDATLDAILTEPILAVHDRVPAIPRTVGAVVSRMLVKDPALRYQSFGELRLELRRLAVEISSPSSHSVPLIVDAVQRRDIVRLVGRETERGQLMQGITQAVSGHGSLIVLCGEAGIGKTRLAEEAMAAARRLGCQTLVGRCTDQDSPPLIPYIEVLEEAARLLPAPVFRLAMGRSGPELAKLLPELHRLFPEMDAPLELPANLRQRFLFTNIREFLTNCCQAMPLVVFIDDIQWADESALQLTQHLAQHLATLPILIVVTYREVEPTPAGRSALQNLFDRVRGQALETVTRDTAKAALDQLVRQRQARFVVLRPLTETDVRDLLAALGHSDPPKRLVQKFVDQTGGNPFFVEELFRHLSDEGRLFDTRNRWMRDVEFAAADVPTSVRMVLERRLQRVPSETHDVLKAAAVIGRHFELDLLEAVVDVDSDSLISALDVAEQARLVKGPSGRQDVTWRFAHQLICQTLAGTIPQLRRQRLHLRIADAMARLDPSSRRYTSDIAHHLYSAGRLADANRTARALQAAGEAAEALYATEDAVQHYRRALDVLQEAGGGEATRLDVEERLADLLAILGDRAEAMEHYAKLAEVHSASHAVVEHARSVRKLGTLHWQQGEREQAMVSYRRALRALEGAKTAHIEAAHLYQDLGLAAFRSGDNQQAIAWAEGALQSAELALSDAATVTPDVRKTATAAIAHATNTIGVALARSGDLDGARERIERSVAIAQEQGLLDVACRGYANLGVLYTTIEPKRAIDTSLTGLALAAKIGAASYQSYIYANLAAAYCALTDHCETEGLQAAHAAATLDRELGQLDHLAVPLIVIAQIHQCQGHLHESEGAFGEALTLAEKMGEPQLMLPCYDGLATIHLDRGDRVLAQQYMEKARDLCERTGLDPDAVLLLPFLC